MPTPQTLDQATVVYRAEKAKFTGALSAIAGSRWLTAVTATLAIGLGSTLVYAPGRSPNLGGVGFSSFGLPDGLDFGAVGEQAGEVLDAAQRQGAGAEAASFLATHADWIPALNAAGFGVALTLLLGNMWLMTARRRASRG